MARRQIRPHARLCRDCNREVRRGDICSTCRNDPTERELAGGRWVGGLVKHWVPDQPELTFVDSEPAQRVEWDLCHCGCLVQCGESCPSCLVWAIKDAEQHAWQQQRWANRHVIWSILDAGKVAA